MSISVVSTYKTFGALLKYLRRRAQLTQQELSIAVGYSEAHISRLEQNQRVPDVATVSALFIPALDLEDEPEIVDYLIQLANDAHSISGERPRSVLITHFRETVEENEGAEEFPSNLPLQLTTFIGRMHEIAEISDLLTREQPARLVTLTGPGGIGKTRLALQTATGLTHQFPDGIWFVDLAPLSSPEHLPQTIASIFNVTERHGQSIIESIITFLKPKHVLILLDNCEHLVQAAAQFSEKSLRLCARLQILATSREPLNILGEVNLHVPALSFPKDVHNMDQSVASHEALQLFIERARSALPSFEMNPENAEAIARICQKLDGMPLGIELAAARTNLLSVSQIEARLNDRLRLLTGGQTTLPRHQTLRAAIEWSHDLLSESEQVLFRRLAVFTGGWILESANAICADDGSDLLDPLTQLVNKSLVMAERQSGAEARYTMLETIREYARERLESSGEIKDMRNRHFAYFCKLAEDARVIGPQKWYWLNRLDAERDNIRSALGWSVQVEPKLLETRVEDATLMLARLAEYYFYRGHNTEALEWFDKLLAYDLPPSRARAMGLQKAGFLTRIRADFVKARSLLGRALAMAREIGDDERAGWALSDIGNAAREVGTLEEVIADYSEALSLFQNLHDVRGTLNSFYELGNTYLQTRELEKARSMWEQGLELSRQMQDKAFIAWGLEGLANVSFLERHAEQARQLHKESLQLKADVMDLVGIAYSFEGLAQAAAADEEPERAALLWGAADRLREMTNTPLEPSRRYIYVSLIPVARGQMGDLNFDETYASGKALKLTDAIQLGLEK